AWSPDQATTGRSYTTYTTYGKHSIDLARIEHFFVLGAGGGTRHIGIRLDADCREELLTVHVEHHPIHPGRHTGENARLPLGAATTALTALLRTTASTTCHAPQHPLQPRTCRAVQGADHLTVDVENGQ